jgi:hypothetical protein
MASLGADRASSRSGNASNLFLPSTCCSLSCKTSRRSQWTE